MATPVGAQDGSIAATNASVDIARSIIRSFRAIFTDPQVAVVGLRESESRAHGDPCACRTIAMDQVPRAQAVRKPQGTIKMVAERETGLC